MWLSYNGTYSRAGIPWMFVLRDILQYDTDIDSAINRLNKAERTCSIFVGLGDNSINQARILEYSHDFVNVGDDKNFPEWDEHPSMDGVVYLDKHSQPSTDTCMGGLLETYYGDIDALKILQVSLSTHTNLSIALLFVGGYLVTNASSVHCTKAGDR